MADITVKNGVKFAIGWFIGKAIYSLVDEAVGRITLQGLDRVLPHTDELIKKMEIRTEERRKERIAQNPGPKDATPIKKGYTSTNSQDIPSV